MKGAELRSGGELREPEAMQSGQTGGAIGKAGKTEGRE